MRAADVCFVGSSRSPPRTPDVET